MPAFGSNELSGLAGFMQFSAVAEFISANWAWALGLAGAIYGLMRLAEEVLAPSRKDSIALWLMGVESEETWARSFCAFVDGLFGARHLSPHCILRSAAASLVAVVVIWLLMGTGGVMALRLQADLSLGSVLVLALAINIVADYVSFWETRILLRWLQRPRTVILQLLVLAVDLVFSAAIIWAAIWLFINSPLYSGEGESFAEILGVFSIFSVLFYSTFLTSVWSWAFIASTWLMRGARRVRLAEWLNIEEKPLQIMGLVAGLAVFLGSLSVAAALQADEDGLTAFDRGLCNAFEGQVCLSVAQLARTEQTQLEYLLQACASGTPEECARRGSETYEVEGADAIRLFDVACEGGSMVGCSYLGYVNRFGIGTAQNLQASETYYRRACEGGNGFSCAGLGIAIRDRASTNAERAEAVPYFERSCELGNMHGCARLAATMSNPDDPDADFEEALRLYTLACSVEDPFGCVGLGFLYERGRGVAQDRDRAAELFGSVCEAGDREWNRIACVHFNRVQGG